VLFLHVCSSPLRSQLRPKAAVASPSASAPVVVTMKKTVAKAPRTISQQSAVFAGMALAFNSGYCNGCCLGGGAVSGANKLAVAAVTGAWTNSALGLASGNMQLFQTQIKALASYIGGSCIAGLMIPRPKAFQIADSTGPTFLVGAALLYAASVFAGKTPNAMTCFYLAAMANGLQNSVSSVSTGNLCRTAHFSGCSSDMGTFLGQYLRGNTENLFKLKSFIMIASSFWIGGFVSFFVTQQMASASLLFSAAAHFLIGMHLIFN